MSAGAPAAGAPAAEKRACPVCDSVSAEKLTRYSTPEWHVVACEDCGFVYLANPPAYVELESELAWEKTSVAEAVRRKRDRPLLMWLDQKTRWRLHRLRPGRQELYRRLFRPGRVLDVGCAGGSGPPEPFVPYGIEISRGLYEQSRAKMTRRGGDAVQGAAAEAIGQFPDGFFTGVIMSSVVEHEAQPKKLLGHVARVLTEDGKAFIRVPNFGSVNRVVGGGKWCGIRHPDHVNYFTVASLRRLAVACGLDLRLLNPLRLAFDDNVNAVLTRSQA